MVHSWGMTNFSIHKTTRTHPTLPFAAIKKDILGTSYELSLTFVGATRARVLNMAHRQKSYVPNVLSFPLSERVGEIYITPAVAAKEAAKFNMTPDGYVGFLFIHGCLHLKGLDHGATMDKAEQKYVRKYQLV